MNLLELQRVNDTVSIKVYSLKKDRLWGHFWVKHFLWHPGGQISNHVELVNTYLGK
jgi:hypothetical protein